MPACITSTLRSRLKMAVISRPLGALLVENARIAATSSSTSVAQRNMMPAKSRSAMKGLNAFLKTS